MNARERLWQGGGRDCLPPAASAMNAPPVAAVAWWERRAVLALLCLLTGLPAAATSVPPLVDYLSHIGRYKVELDLAASPLLQRNWSFEWALIANLGVDILIVPLARLFGLERAAWLVAVLVPVLLAWGFVRTARAIHGRVPAAALATLPFATAYPYQFGFINYWLSVALAFHILASWLNSPGTGRARSVAFAAASLGLWLCHAYGWGILGVMVGGAELARLIGAGERRVGAIAAKLSARGWPLLAPLPLMLLWRAQGRSAEGGTGNWFLWAHKLEELVATLRDQSSLLDIGTLAGVGLLVYVGARGRRVGLDPRLAIPAAALLALFILLPYVVFGSAYADSRLLPVMFVCAVLAVRPSPGVQERVIAAAALGVFLVRVTIGTAGFVRYDRAYASHLSALDRVAAGARIAALVVQTCGEDWRRPRTEHLASLAIVRREAFVNSQWNVGGAQLLTSLGGRGTPFNADPSQMVWDDRCDGDHRGELAATVARVPRNRFDHVWIFNFKGPTPPAYPGWTPLFADDTTILYGVAR